MISIQIVLWNYWHFDCQNICFTRTNIWRAGSTGFPPLSASAMTLITIFWIFSIAQVRSQTKWVVWLFRRHRPLHSDKTVVLSLEVSWVLVHSLQSRWSPDIVPFPLCWYLSLPAEVPKCISCATLGGQTFSDFPVYIKKLKYWANLRVRRGISGGHSLGGVQHRMAGCSLQFPRLHHPFFPSYWHEVSFAVLCPVYFTPFIFVGRKSCFFNLHLHHTILKKKKKL